jgi:hypothetical protein
MRCLSLSLVAAVVALAALPAQALELPKRKPGLWEMKSTSGEGAPPMVMQQCTDEAFETQMQKMALETSKTMCSKNDMKREGSTITGSAECKMGSISVTSKSVATGDFTSAYKVVVNSTFNPPMMGKSSDTSVIEARWVGACAPGQKPGMPTMPNMPVSATPAPKK